MVGAVQQTQVMSRFFPSHCIFLFSCVCIHEDLEIRLLKWGSHATSVLLLIRLLMQVHKSAAKTAGSKKSIKKGGRGDMGLTLEEGECSRHSHHEAPPDSPPVHHLATLDPLDHNLFTPQPHVHG